MKTRKSLISSVNQVLGTYGYPLSLNEGPLILHKGLSTPRQRQRQGGLGQKTHIHLLSEITENFEFLTMSS